MRDAELNMVSVWINNCISRMCLNACIDGAKCSIHEMYSFNDFINGTVNTSKMDNEPLPDYWIRIKNLKPLFS